MYLMERAEEAERLDARFDARVLGGELARRGPPDFRGWRRSRGKYDRWFAAFLDMLRDRVRFSYSMLLAVDGTRAGTP
jgi:hypothetical protein